MSSGMKMGTGTGSGIILLRGFPVMLKVLNVLATIANAKKGMFIVEDMEKEVMVSRRSTIFKKWI